MRESLQRPWERVGSSASAGPVFDAIHAKLGEGCTVLVATAARTTKVTPATAKRWERAGNQLFKATGSSLYMASGRSFVCIDGCAIIATS